MVQWTDEGKAKAKGDTPLRRCVVVEVVVEKEIGTDRDVDDEGRSTAEVCVMNNMIFLEVRVGT